MIDYFENFVKVTILKKYNSRVRDFFSFNQRDTSNLSLHLSVGRIALTAAALNKFFLSKKERRIYSLILWKMPCNLKLYD